nr:hypothetical protein [Tanacetum cinerariifolium]
YPMDGGDDGDDDDGDSSRDDDEDEDEDDEEEEEHLALADSTIVIPTVELVSPPEGIDPVIPPPSTNTTTTGARIAVQFQAAISLPPKAEVERLLAMPTPLSSPLTSLSPPSAGERLARDDILKTEMPPRKRQCLSTLGSRYEIRDSSTARPTEGRGIEYGFISTLDAEARRRGIREVRYGIKDTWVDLAEAVPKITPMTLGEVNTRVIELTELYEHDTQDLYALLEDAQDSRMRISQRVTMDSQRVDLLMEDRTAHQETILIAEIAELRETDRRHQAQMVETLQVMGDMRQEMGDMQAELWALREQPRRARQPREDARVPNHQDDPRDADSHI